MLLGTTLVYQPLITEKSMQEAGRGWYSFKVSANATKPAIVRDIKVLYNVDVIEVRTMKRTGKMRRAGRRQTLIQKPDWKKAVVRLKAGQRIPIFEVGDSAPVK